MYTERNVIDNHPHSNIYFYYYIHLFHRIFNWNKISFHNRCLLQWQKYQFPFCKISTAKKNNEFFFATTTNYEHAHIVLKCPWCIPYGFIHFFNNNDITSWKIYINPLILILLLCVLLLNTYNLNITLAKYAYLVNWKEYNT